MNINNQWDIRYWQIRILKKPEELQIITPAALERLSGIADQNSNGNIMK